VLTFFYRAAWTAARAAAPLLARGEGKLARGARGRLAAVRTLAGWAALHRDTSRPLIWFHAASVGEGRQAEVVVRRLRTAHPEWQIAWTHSSASAERLAASLPVDVACYVPPDSVADVGAALGALRPSALVFSATDLWPELVRQAAARGVRLGVISATLAPTSSRRGPLARALLRDAYAALDAVGAIDEADARGLAALGVRAERIVVTGDTRHDAAVARALATDREAPALRALRRAAARAPLLIAGSTWPADEQVLLPALARVRASHPLGVVIAPHEPTEEALEKLERLLGVRGQEAGGRVVRLSALETAEATSPHSPLPAPDWDFCLVDRVGILADLYAAGSVAFVGGGFHGAGLHSVIEPAALGLPVLFGPEWRSSRDARLLQERGGGASVADGAALAAALERWLSDDAARAAASAAARAVVGAGLGAAERSAKLVENLLKAES
jgi:3-deoxy-D-manno-octulosonic-acid transferase